jgi:hypothetical protein
VTPRAITFDILDDVYQVLVGFEFFIKENQVDH